MCVCLLMISVFVLYVVRESRSHDAHGALFLVVVGLILGVQALLRSCKMKRSTSPQRAAQLVTCCKFAVAFLLKAGL